MTSREGHFVTAALKPARGKSPEEARDQNTQAGLGGNQLDSAKNTCAVIIDSAMETREATRQQMKGRPGSTEGREESSPCSRGFILQCGFKCAKGMLLGSHWVFTYLCVHKA